MATNLRRLFWLAMMGGAGYAGWTAWQSRASDESPASSETPTWPPLESEPAPPPVPEPASDVAAFASVPSDQRWAAPVDGGCPDGYPIKANDNSMIFHMPGGRFYDRTVPERCYADAADAEADGYRRSKA